MYYSISDFVAPVSSNKMDYIGCFAVAIHGVDDICKQFEAAYDDFKCVSTRITKKETT